MAENKHMKEARTSSRTAGICTSYNCKNKPADDRIQCQECLNKTSNARKLNKVKWKESGVCIHCGGCRLGSKNVCEKCYFIQASTFNLGSSKYWKLLQELLEVQEYKCALTGDQLTSDDMELDHIKPISKGGSKTINNVRWVTSNANQAKCHLTDKEFIELCNKVIKYNK